MKIRSYNLSDEKEIIQLWAECSLILSQNDPIRDIKMKMKVNPELFLIGELNGKIIASCMAGYEGHRGSINYLAVLPKFQKEGYGAKILQKAEKLLTDIGCPKINLQIRKSNKKVVKFYKSLGYNVDEVINMGKRLEFREIK